MYLIINSSSYYVFECLKFVKPFLLNENFKYSPDVRISFLFLINGQLKRALKSPNLKTFFFSNKIQSQFNFVKKKKKNQSNTFRMENI